MNHLTRPADLAALHAATLADAGFKCYRFDTPRAAMRFAREIEDILYNLCNPSGPFLVARRGDGVYDVEIHGAEAISIAEGVYNAA